MIILLTWQAGSHSRDFHEAELAKWKPAESYRAPTGTPQDGSKELAGTWRVGGGRSVTTLKFSWKGPDSISVFFSTAGCLDEWSTTRTAKFNHGLVTLNRPVEPYFGFAFDRLHLVLRGGELCLIPTGSVERAMELSTSGGSLEHWVDLFAFKK